MYSSSTGLTSVMSICISLRAERSLCSARSRKNSALGRHNVLHKRLDFVYRRTPVPVPQPAKPPQVIHNTVYQTVVHVHQTTLQRICRQIHAANYLRQDAVLFVLPQPSIRPKRDRLDPAQPTRAAHTLLRIFSKESARREMKPFYSDVVRGVLQEEQERYKSRPTKAISLIWSLLGQHNAFQTLTRFCLGVVEKLGSNRFPALSGANFLYLAAGVLMHRQVYQRYIHQIWSRESHVIPLRYASREGVVTEDLLRLPAARRMFLPSRDELERMVRSAAQERAAAAPEAAPAPEVRLSEPDFRALVRGVTNSIDRQTRLDALRKGGV